MRKLLKELQPGTTYNIQVRSIRGSETSEWSNRFTFTTESYIIKPQVPSSVTWISTGDSFFGDWNSVSTNVNGQAIPIARYELELTAGAFTAYKSVPQVTGAKASFSFSFEDNRATFPTPQGVIGLKVRAVDVHGNKSDPSPIVTATNAAPGAPTGPAVGAVATSGSGQIELAWTAPSDTDLIGFNVYAGTTAGFTPSGANKIYSGNSNRFVYQTNSTSTQYFKIRAVDKFNQESTDLTGNAAATSVFAVDVTAPATPAGLAASIGANANGIGAYANVSWTANGESDLAGYVVRYRRNGSADNYTNVTVEKGSTSIRVPLEFAYTSYDFQIRAFDWSANYSAYNSAVTASGGSNAAPATVTGLTANPGRDTITYTWAQNTEADVANGAGIYELEFSANVGFTGTTLYRTGANSITIAGLAPSTPYWARVKAIDSAGIPSASPSSVVSTTTTAFPSVAPTDTYAPGSSPTPSVMSGLGHLYVNWSPVTLNSNGGAQVDPVTYEVHLSTSTGFTPSGATKVTEVSGTFALVDILPGTTTPLSYGTTYYIKLIAKDRDGAAAAGTQGSGTISKVASTDVTSIGADLIVPGTGIINNLIINTSGAIQSANYVANTTGFKIDNAGIDIGSNGYINAGALKAGTVTAVTINIGATGTINVDSTGAIKSNNWASLSTGYKLSNTGLEVNDGSIDAKSLRAGTAIIGDITVGRTADALGEIKSFGYVANTTGFRLHKTGLEINNGAIKAATLLLQSGQNIMPTIYADFEATVATYTGKIFQDSGSTIRDVNTTGGKFGPQKYGAIWGSQGVPIRWYFGTSVTDYNIPVEENKTYIFSAYVWSGYVQNSTLKVKWSTGTTVTLDSQNTNATNTPASAIRNTGAATAPAGATGAVLIWECTTTGASGGVSIDGIQVEEKLAGINTPSSWTPASSTAIEGGQIRTGSIQSNILDSATNSVWDEATGAFVPGPGQPLWSINMSGGATFREVLVKGRILVGDGTETTSTLATISSSNYAEGVSGWMIRSDGFAEFREMAVDSIKANWINAVSPESFDSGAMEASITVDGTLAAIDKETLSITNKFLTSNVATLTTETTHSRNVGDRIFITGVDATFDTPVGNMDYITAVTSTTFSYIRVASNVSSTAVSPFGEAQATGRSVVMDPRGLRLYDTDGVSLIIELPTNPAQDSLFTGNVSATSLEIRDKFYLQGANNVLAAGSTLTLAASVMAPAMPPVVTSTYQNYETWFSGASGEDFTVDFLGTFQQGTSFFAINHFYGGQVFEYAQNTGSFVSNTPLAGTGFFAAPWGMAKVSGNWYALVSEYDTALYKVYKYNATGTGWSTKTTGWNGGLDEMNYSRAADFGVTTAQFKPKNEFSTGILYDPGMGTDLITNEILIARCGTDGKIKISRYTTAGVFVSTVTTNVVASDNIRSVMKGTFDFASARYVITTRGRTGKPAKNYVIDATTLNQMPNETWGTPNDQNVIGTGYDANTSSFYSLMHSTRRHYKYTSVAHNVTTNWSVKSTWYDNDATTVAVTNKVADGTTATLTVGSGHGYTVGDEVVVAGVDVTFNGTYILTAVASTTVSYAKAATVATTAATGTVGTTVHESALSAAKPFTAVRRAQLNVSVSDIAYSGKKNDPNAVRFYISNAGSTGTHYLQTDNPTMINYQTFTSTPTFSGTSTSPNNFPAGTPSKFVSSNGLMEISSDGFMRTNRLVLQSTLDADRTATNTPPLMIGNPAAAHLRLDNNEILAMSSSTGIAVLSLNAGGTTAVTNLNISGVVTTDVDSAGVVYGDNLQARNQAGSGTVAANVNANGTLLRSGSARRLKKNIKPIGEEVIDKMLLLQPVSFDWNPASFENEMVFPDHLTHPGFIADQAAEVGLDLWVSYRPDGQVETFDYPGFTAALLLLAQKQEKRIASLEARLDND